jgi:protein tyrosine phosphatase (PTP) superfamily phosphohydrolase (DUF442 family)
MFVIHSPEHESYLVVCWPRDTHVGWQCHGRVMPVVFVVVVVVAAAASVVHAAAAVVIAFFPELAHCRSRARATLVQHRRRR